MPQTGQPEIHLSIDPYQILVSNKFSKSSQVFSYFSAVSHPPFNGLQSAIQIVIFG
jgi:hypothetical protein